MDKYWSSVLLIFDVVDLDIGHVAHINSGSYRGEVETHQKREQHSNMASMRKQ
jgi:hypothetical protein